MSARTKNIIVALIVIVLVGSACAWTFSLINWGGLFGGSQNADAPQTQPTATPQAQSQAMPTATAKVQSQEPTSEPAQPNPTIVTEVESDIEAWVPTGVDNPGSVTGTVPGLPEGFGGEVYLNGVQFQPGTPYEWQWQTAQAYVTVHDGSPQLDEYSRIAGRPNTVIMVDAAEVYTEGMYCYMCVVPFYIGPTDHQRDIFIRDGQYFTLVFNPELVEGITTLEQFFASVQVFASEVAKHTSSSHGNPVTLYLWPSWSE